MEGFLAHRARDARYASERGGRVRAESTFSGYVPGLSRGLYAFSATKGDDSGDDDGPLKKKKRIFKKGEDADGDGKTNEAEKNKPKKEDWKKDADGDGVPAAIDKDEKKKKKDDKKDKD